MIELTWKSDTTKNSSALADAIELAVAFADDDFNSHFTKADFQRVVDSENLSDDGSSYLSGDQADERIEHYEQALDIIQKREAWFGDIYPFTVEDDEVRLTYDVSINRCLPYLFLVMCSNRDYVPTLKSALPVHFEDLCKEALRVMFPGWADVFLFSKDSYDRRAVFGRPADEGSSNTCREAKLQSGR